MTQSSESFIHQYLSYVGETEAPMIYHRWAALSMVGAYLGREFSFSHGHFEINPNLYVMLIGDPGTRKSTAIRLAKKIILAAGYDKISSDKTSKEKFMLDLSGEGDENEEGKLGGAGVDVLERNLWGKDSEEKEVSEMYIACDEFNDFIGLGNLEFISLLGNLWDFNGVFKNRIKNGKSVEIFNPTISILGGNTPTSFANAFPADTLNQGFFSRLLLVHGEGTGRLITFPKKPSAESTARITAALQEIKLHCSGSAKLSEEAEELVDKIYKGYGGMEDFRFKYYVSRRLAHLLKLCLIIAASYRCVEISKDHVIEANTILTHTEIFMPKALGEFGRAKNSDVTNKLVEIFRSADEGLDVKSIWALMSSDLNKMQDLMELLRNLSVADKIFVSGGKFYGKTKVREEKVEIGIDWNYLTEEERGMML